jgi:hypothetical protein
VGKDVCIEGLVVATGMTLLATIGDMINDHRFASLWFTIYACAGLICYVSLGAPIPFAKKNRSEQ